jgi:hypothetical protein
MAEKTKINRDDVVEILSMNQNETSQHMLQMITAQTNHGRLVCTLIATVATAINDPEYRKQLNSEAISDTIEILPNLPQWVSNHPEKF